MTLHRLYASTHRVAAVAVVLLGLVSSVSLALGNGSMRGPGRYSLVLAALVLCVATPGVIAIRKWSPPWLSICCFLLASICSAALAGSGDPGPLGVAPMLFAVVVAFPILVMATLLRAETSLDKPRNRL